LGVPFLGHHWLLATFLHKFWQKAADSAEAAFVELEQNRHQFCGSKLPD